jgi:hypothetical protein
VTLVENFEMTMQLALPGINRREPRVLRARRDYSEAQFERALARNGLTFTAGGAVLVDTAGRKFIVIYRRDSMTIARRATVAHVRKISAASLDVR